MHCSNAIRTFSLDKGSWRKPRLFAVTSSILSIKILNSSWYCIPHFTSTPNNNLVAITYCCKRYIRIIRNISVGLYSSLDLQNATGNMQYAIATVHSGNCQPTGTRCNIPSCGLQEQLWLKWRLPGCINFVSTIVFIVYLHFIPHSILLVLTHL